MWSSPVISVAVEMARFGTWAEPTRTSQVCENGAGGTIKAPRQARAVIHVENLRHGGQIYMERESRKGDRELGIENVIGGSRGGRRQ